MAEVTAALVKELRDKTGAGMMDCKRALGETAGDMEAAVDWLRKKGIASAAKKTGRVAAAGLAVGRGVVSSYVHNALGPGIGKIGVLVALESEAAEEALATLGRQLAMQVAAANPLYLDIAAVPATELERERAVLLDQPEA